MSEASAHVKILTECGGINQGDTTRGHPKGRSPAGWPRVVSPRLIPTHEVELNMRSSI